MNDRQNNGRPFLSLIPSTAGRRWIAAVSVFVVASFLHVELLTPVASLGLFNSAKAQTSIERSLGIIIVPRRAADAAAAMVARGLLRGISDRMAGQGMTRAPVSSVDNPFPVADLEAMVAQGAKLMNDGKWTESLELYRDAETKLLTLLPIAPRALVARVYKGLGLSLQQNRRQMQAKEMVRRAVLLWPGQKQAEYAYNLETKNLFQQIQREIVDSPKGSLFVETSEPGAEVYIDYEFKGFSPLQIPELTTGDHLITVILDGFNAEARFATVRGMTEERVDFFLAEAFNAPDIEALTSTIISQSNKGVVPGKEIETLSGLVKATDLVVAQVYMEGNDFVVEGAYGQLGFNKLFKDRLPQSDELIVKAEALLAALTGVRPGADIAQASLDAPSVVMPTAGSSALIDISQVGDDVMIDPDAPIFKDTGKKDKQFNVVKKWWFWTALAVGVGAIAGVTYWGVDSARKAEGGGVTGRVNISINAVE